MTDTNLRILVVEDDTDDFFLFRKVLQRTYDTGFTVERAVSFDDGLAKLQAQAFDVCFVDYRLGDRDGIELMRTARERGAAGPFIMLTGASDRETDLAAMRAGAADYLVKGSAPELVERAVRYAIEAERAATALRSANDELERRVAERTEELKVKMLDLAAAEVNERSARIAIERLYEEAQHTARLKDEFLAGLSHELRTPMNSIIGFTELLLDGDASDEEKEEWLAAIQRNSQTQMQLIEDLLDLSRIVTGKIAFATLPVDLAEVARSVVASLQVLATRRKQTLRIHTGSAESFVTGDQTRLEQVVTNLVSNALKFTPEGGHVDVTVDGGGDRDVRLTVRDDGQGIDPKFLPHVFERFRQEDGRTARRQGGLGLGLSLVHHFVMAHRGVITAESAGAGKGATFTATFPRRAPEPENQETLPRAKMVSATAATILPRLRVLLVDDSADIQRYVSAIMARSGVVPVMASSAAEARQALASEKIDVILCDIAMPGEDGYEFMRSLRQSSAYSHVPAIALTAFAREEDRATALAAGFDAHIAKPFNSETLLNTLAFVADK